ncbi:MAG: hypothetical protein AB3N63_02700 [Puniceicoccaceae bacterium]
MRLTKLTKPLMTTLCLVLVTGLPGAPDLEIFEGNYPVSFFFRQTESEASKTRNRLSYEEWSTNFSQLNGVMGKMLDEEVLGRSHGQEYFRRFKQDHPRQAVFLHANGGFRKPLADISEYHDGHWLYYNGAIVKDPISADEEVITIRVSDTTLFQMHPYRNNPDLADDVGLCTLNADGTPDWNHAEQTVLLAINEKAGTITLKRSVYADRKRHSYKAGKAYVASHVAQNWGTTNKLWEFNMAATCPKDAMGRQAADVWAGELIRDMSPGGAIDFIDGYQFDVPFIRPISLGRGRQPDADADGVADFGIVNGEHVFTHGVERFFRNLTEAFPEKLIMADSGGKSQRSLRYLNGMETEGFPELRDIDFNFWSTSINYHRFWNTRSREPRFHYGLMKFLRWERQPTLADSRLIIAGTTLHDAAVPLGDVKGRERWFVMDEVLGGTLKKKGWLGKPVGPAKRLWRKEKPFGMLSVENGNTKIRRSENQIHISKSGPKVRDMRFAFEGLKLDKATDLVIVLAVKADHRIGLPEGYYRELSMELESTTELPHSITDTDYVTPVDETPFEAVFYIRDVPKGKLALNFVMEGNEEMQILDFSIYPSTDASFREFEKGAILANPSNEPVEFDLNQLAPSQSFRRLKATPGQDKKTNNGKAVGKFVVVPARDALFLLKD